MKKIQLLMNPLKFFEQLEEVYDTLTQNDNYKRKLREKHEKYGTLRSGEGTPAEVMKRQRDHQELQQLKEIRKQKQVVEDVSKQQKLYQLYLEDFKQNGIRNDENDLSIHHKVQSFVALPINDGLRSLQQAQSQDINIQELNEKYPDGQCFNSGQLAKITQRYYLCNQILDDKQVGDEFRVTEQTYNILSTNYSSGHTCRTEDVEKQICICPKGHYGVDCTYTLYQKCFISITNPPFNKGCSDREDSPYYMYSIPGYDPCFYFDFTKSYTIGYQLVCKYIDETGMVDVNSENMGYQYRDVIKFATMTNQFNYTAENPKTKYTIIGNLFGSIRLDFRDMKWLSQKTSFYSRISDAEIQVGNKEGYIYIDLSQVKGSDDRGESTYLVGGRAYFEAAYFGNDAQSFVTKGFFDQEGYIEPAPKSSVSLALILGLTFGGIAVITIIVVVIVCQRKKNKKLKELHTD